MSFLSGRTSLTTVQAGDIATDAITTAKIAASAVTTAKIAANNIDSTLTKDALIADYTEVTAATGDSILLGDVNDSGNTKRDTVQGLLDLVSAGGFTLGTATATTSGTSVTWGSIPSGTSMIVISVEQMSWGTTDRTIVTLGDAGGIETSSYTGLTMMTNQSATSDELGTLGSAFRITSDLNAAQKWDGNITLTLANSSTNLWICSAILGDTAHAPGVSNQHSGTKALSDTLTQLTIAGEAGQTFDSGSVNIMYQ